MKKELLMEILQYIESREEYIDKEFGSCRRFAKIEADKNIPSFYGTLKDLLYEKGIYIYEVYLLYGGETGVPNITKEDRERIYASSYEEAFNKWLRIYNYEGNKFKRVSENIWYDYYSVYVNKV